MNKKAEQTIEKHTERRSLPVLLTQDEMLEQAKLMADASEEAEAQRAELKTVTTQIKARIEEAEAKATGARVRLRSGYEYRPVPCTVTKDWSTKTVTVRRDDTGEIVSARDMTNQELQIEIQIGTK